MAVSILIVTHDQVVAGADVLRELGLSNADCSRLDDYDKRNLAKVQGELGGQIKLRGLAVSEPEQDAELKKQCTARVLNHGKNMATEIYVASISNGCAIAAVDGSKLAQEINAVAAVEGRMTSVDDLDRFLRERAHVDEISLYGLGVYTREVDAT